MANAPDLMGMLPAELESWLKEQGEPAYRGRQIFQWIHQKNVFTFEEMNNLPKALREKLAASAVLYLPPVLKQQTAADGTRKLKADEFVSLCQVLGLTLEDFETTQAS